MTTPKRAATKNFKKSFLSIFCLDTKRLNNQNNIVAPATLNNTKPNGLI